MRYVHSKKLRKINMAISLVKVCGMRIPHNIEELTQLPINYIGFIFYKKSKRFVSTLPLVEMPDTIKKVGVFVNSTIEDVKTEIAHGLQAVQLHGDESAAYCQSIKDTGVEVIKAFGIGSVMDWKQLEPYTTVVDYFLFDTSSAQYGGTGITFDWQILKEYPYDTPYFLSGGLDIDNIPTAQQITDPRLVGLDLNSRFEIEPGLKNINRIKEALKIIKR